ncbi:uncharacterized protein LOC129846935 [Salvelinus fontinalis]|uniref:uncharacterized protein LOC129846935 n=1 Tax=Salvelinus fontinalis TaxID=8038 RepID=UPI00248601CF|nr:uncharacterized protein LOC129846935 [Salvelinus fontinalis]
MSQQWRWCWRCFGADLTLCRGRSKATDRVVGTEQPQWVVRGKMADPPQVVQHQEGWRTKTIIHGAAPWTLSTLAVQEMEQLPGLCLLWLYRKWSSSLDSVYYGCTGNGAAPWTLSTLAVQIMEQLPGLCLLWLYRKWSSSLDSVYSGCTGNGAAPWTLSTLAAQEMEQLPGLCLLWLHRKWSSSLNSVYSGCTGNGARLQSGGHKWTFKN